MGEEGGGGGNALNDGRRGLLVRLNESLFITVPDSQTLLLLAEDKGAPPEIAAELARFVPEKCEGLQRLVYEALSY